MFGYWLTTNILEYRHTSLSYITLNQQKIRLFMNCSPYLVFWLANISQQVYLAVLVLDQETEKEDLYY